MSRAAIIPDAKLVSHCLDGVFSRAPDATLHESLTERSVHEKLSYCFCILLS